MQYGNNQSGNAAVWVVGIVAIIALIIGWAAFNRSGEDLSDVVVDETQEALEEAERATARAIAVTRLAALRAQVEAEEVGEEAVQELNEIEADLAVAYENAEDEAAEAWRDIEVAFDNLEKSLRDGTGDVLDFFADLIRVLESDVRSDGR